MAALGLSQHEGLTSQALYSFLVATIVNKYYVLLTEFMRDRIRVGELDWIGTFGCQA